MDQPSLEGVWEKHRRAEAHLDCLKGQIDSFFQRDPQPIGHSAPYLDPESGWYVVHGFIQEPFPLRLGVILGDVIHNARSALDHLVWQLVRLNEQTPREGPEGNSWPFAHTKTGWRKAKKTALHGVRPSHRDLIRGGQPYTGGRGSHQTFPAAIQSLSNVDKHQVVHATYAALTDPGDALKFRVVSGPGDVVRSQFLPGGKFEHRAPLLRALVEGRSAETKVDVDGDIPVEIAFGQRAIRMAAVEASVAWVGVVIKTFEPDFLGTTPNQS